MTLAQLFQMTSSAAVGQEKFVTARVTDDQGRPVRDLEVDFSAVGANPAGAHRATAKNGEALFSYVGSSPGEDVITAKLLDIQKSVTNTWKVPTGNQPPVVSTLGTSNTQYGLTLQLTGTVTDETPSLGGRWTQLSGVEAVIENATQNSTRVFCPDPGVYVFALSANDSEFETRATVTVRADLLPAITFPVWNIDPVIRVGTNVWLVADASDPDDSIGRVEFYANGTLQGIATNRMFWQYWDETWVPFESGSFPVAWTPTSPGTYALHAVAYDRYGGAATSAVTTVEATYSPSVVIDNISNGTVVTVPTNVIVHASANDPDGTITSLSIYVNGELLGTTSNGSLSSPWFPRRQGDYTLSAVATDNLGITTTSDNVTVTVTGVFPQVVITNPVPVGFAFESPAGKPIQLAADASIAGPSTITNVVFTVWSDPVASASQPPYQGRRI